MGETVSFRNERPPSRFDGIPWSEARVNEATTATGPWTLIDTIALLPLDTNPANPIMRNLTTTLGTAPDLWYTITYADAFANVSLPTAPVQNLPSPASGDGGGPCTDWITGEDVVLCCDVEGDASDSTIYDFAAVQAQALLFELSGRRFNGVCEQTVRPCRTWCACGWQVLSRGHIVWNPNWGGYGWGTGSWMCDDSPCGCMPLSQVPLSGYVQDIIEIKIDGVVIDPATYRVDRHRWLVRQRLSATDDTTPVWPGCQSLDLPLDEPGTWSVTYTYGVDVPVAGQAAAAELACEIYKACAGNEDCRLPNGVQRVTRQGIVIEKTPFTVWGWTTGKRAGQVKGWNTGMPMVDAFLNAYNPGGLPRVPTIWSPTTALRFPVPVTLVGT